MKISAYSAVAFALLTGATFVTSCANDVEIVINDDPTGNAISFSPVVGHSTRATETTFDNLGNFAVVARGIHHDGILYDNFLIGSGTEGDIATRLEDKGKIWTLNHNVYWPSTFEQVMFFAYTTLKSGETGSVLGDNVNFGFDSKNPYIDNYQPKKADMTLKSDEAGTVWSDGKVQKDLLVAYTKQARSTNPTTVSLTFKHALTQISITAKQKEKPATDHRIVKIKGAWIVNAAQSGKLVGNLNYNPEDYNSEDKTDNVTQSWTGSATKTVYGSFYNQILELDANSDVDLLRPEVPGGTLGSLMLIPEDLTAWDKTNEGNGAYILLLCRVELKHTGATHDTVEGSDVDMSDIATDGVNHYHQLFPVNTAEYDGTEYGFVCVPLSSDWNTNGIGKHYTYNLDICGATTDAGLYPPTMSAADIAKLIPSNSKVTVIGKTGLHELKVVTARADKKNVGDPVLDRPIQFTVDVEKWGELKSDEWTPGNGNF